MSRPLPRVVASRVDWLTLAMRLVISDRRREELLEVMREGRDIGSEMDARIGGQLFCVRRTRMMNTIPWAVPEANGLITLDDANGWNAELSIKPVWLARHTLPEAIALAVRLLGSFGPIEEVAARRADLAVDIAGWWFDPSDPECFSGRSTRAAYKKTGGDELLPPVKLIMAPDGGVEGLAISPGNVLMARLYDKRCELGQKRQEEKIELEHGIWAAAGVGDDESVWRLEFQHKSEVLRDMRVRDPSELARCLDNIFQYDVQWVRLIDPTSSERRCRCKDQERWTVVREHHFEHAGAAPQRRTRLRGTASRGMLFGCLRSWLGKLGVLKPMEAEVITEDGEVLRGEEALVAMSEEDRKQWVYRQFTQLAVMMAENAAADELAEFGVLVSAKRLLHSVNAAVARFIGESTGPPERAPPTGGTS